MSIVAVLGGIRFCVRVKEIEKTRAHDRSRLVDERSTALKHRWQIVTISGVTQNYEIPVLANLK